MENIKIYLDEDVRPLLAEVLRKRNYDAVSCVEKGFFGLTDEKQLITAIESGRTMFSYNIRDFVNLHNKYYSRHYGIIVSEQIAFSIVLKRMLKLLSIEKPGEIKGRLIWLNSYI